MDNNPFYFSMHAQKVAPKNDNLFTYQISFDDAASAYQSSVDTYKLPGFKYRFYHFDTPPDLPITDLEGATLVHAGNAGGNLNAEASANMAGRQVAHISFMLPKDAIETHAPGATELYLYISPTWDINNGSEQVQKSLDPQAVDLQLMGLTEDIPALFMDLLVKLDERQDEQDNPVGRCLRRFDECYRVKHQRWPLPVLIEWESGIKNISRVGTSGQFKIGVHNHFKDPDKTLAELGVDISDNSLDAILLIADSARQATINRIASVDCGTATESCLWYEEVTPVHAPTGVETARRYNDGTFMENVLNFIGLSAENGWFNLNEVGDAVDEIENIAKSVGLAKIHRVRVRLCSLQPDIFRL